MRHDAFLDRPNLLTHLSDVFGSDTLRGWFRTNFCRSRQRRLGENDFLRSGASLRLSHNHLWPCDGLLGLGDHGLRSYLGGLLLCDNLLWLHHKDLGSCNNLLVRSNDLLLGRHHDLLGLGHHHLRLGHHHRGRSHDRLWCGIHRISPPRRHGD